MSIQDRPNYTSGSLVTLPLVLIKSRVMFPHIVVPIYINDKKIFDAIEQKSGVNIFVSAYKHFESASRVDSSSDPNQHFYRTGTVCTVISSRKLPDGRYKALVQGLFRAFIVAKVNHNGVVRAKVRKIEDSNIEAQVAKVGVMVDVVRSSLEKIMSLGKLLSPDLIVVLEGIKDPGKFADMIACHLNMKLEEAQNVLEIRDPIQRLSKIHAYLCKEIENYQIEYYARSRSDKASEKPLEPGEAKSTFPKQRAGPNPQQDHHELDVLFSKLQALPLSKNVFEEVSRQLTRLTKMPQESSEAIMLRNYIEVFLSMPWGIQTKDIINLKNVGKTLNEEHFGLSQVKDRVLEYLAVKSLNPQVKSPILCFVGPPGVGKTSLGESIAKAIGRNFARISLGGVRDEADIRGHRKTYVGAYPGRILQSIKNAKSFNPVIVLDEIDKLGSGQRGDPAAALLEVLDPEQNQNFVDHFLGVPSDLSNVLFIANANSLDTISEPLKDRLEIIEISGYSEEEKIDIVDTFMFKRKLKESGLDKYSVSMTKECMSYLIRSYTRESGLREVERQLASICRKIARQVAEDEQFLIRGEEFKITNEKIKEYIGLEKFSEQGQDFKEQGVGISLAMAYTVYGGQILSIETSMVPGQSKLVLTGQLGHVMQESAQAAFTYIKSKCHELGINPQVLENREVHVHIPQGAVPKEGPSAGIALATSILSSLLGKPVRQGFCMTGEMTLHGKILAIGGVKEKILAAQRVGLRKVILPEQNRADMEALPVVIKDKMRVSYATEYLEVFRLLYLGDQEEVASEDKEMPLNSGSLS